MPDINSIEKTSVEVVSIFPMASRILDNDIDIKIPIGRHDNFSYGGNLYFKTTEEALASEAVFFTPYMGGWRLRSKSAIPAGCDYYVVRSDPDGRGDSQTV